MCLASKNPEAQRVHGPPRLARHEESAGDGIVEAGQIAESGAPMRPGQQRERRGSGRSQARGVPTGCGHRRASPLRFAERTRPARRVPRARAPRRVHQVQPPAPLRRSPRLQRRAAAHVPRRCAPTTRACVKGRRSPTRRPDGDLRSRRRQRRPAGRPRSHRCVVHRGARGPATSTPPPSGRSRQPTRPATAPPRTTRAPAGRVPDSRAACRT